MPDRPHVVPFQLLSSLARQGRRWQGKENPVKARNDHGWSQLDISRCRKNATTGIVATEWYVVRGDEVDQDLGKYLWIPEAKLKNFAIFMRTILANSIRMSAQPSKYSNFYPDLAQA